MLCAQCIALAYMPSMGVRRNDGNPRWVLSFAAAIDLMVAGCDDLVSADGQPIAGEAVTTVEGTALCAPHAAYHYLKP